MTVELIVREEGRYYHCFGLDATNTPVAYLSCLPQLKAAELCDIEVREEYRGHGYSKAIIEAAQEHFGKAIIHTGGYTPDGIERIAHYFRPQNIVETMRPEFRPMSFVHDWEQMTTK